MSLFKNKVNEHVKRDTRPKAIDFWGQFGENDMDCDDQVTESMSIDVNNGHEAPADGEVPRLHVNDMGRG